MDDDINWRVLRVRIFLEAGLPFEQIDQIGFKDLGDIIGYWSGKDKAEDRIRKNNKMKAGKGGKGR